MNPVHAMQPLWCKQGLAAGIANHHHSSAFGCARARCMCHCAGRWALKTTAAPLAPFWPVAQRAPSPVTLLRVDAGHPTLNP